MFTETLWVAPSRAFVAAWDGSGVDPEIVDVDALRRCWQVDGAIGPNTLLQSIWLAGACRSSLGREHAE